MASSLYFFLNASPLIGLSGIMALLPPAWQPIQYAFVKTFSPRCWAASITGVDFWATERLLVAADLSDAEAAVFCFGSDAGVACVPFSAFLELHPLQHSDSVNTTASVTFTLCADIFCSNIGFRFR